MRMGEIDQLALKTGSQIIPADATSVEDLENLLDYSIFWKFFYIFRRTPPSLRKINRITIVFLMPFTA